MKASRFGLLAALAMCLGLARVSRADVQVAVDHNDLDHSTAEFKFKSVPSPAKTNAAIKAKFSVVDGEKDGNGAELDVLHDGKLPTEQDQPDQNFFFNAGTDGGRIGIDLGSVIDVKQVNTYSWHADTRAPQVYSLYAADGTADKFNAAPKNDVDPTTVGWKLITKVDTRPKAGDTGGQYGVSVSDSAGSLGKFRYLLLVATKTESDDDFGNTFYSELNVISSDEMLNAPAKGDNADKKLVEFSGGKYSVLIDTSDTPELTSWAQNELAPVVVEWYPKLVEMLPSPGYSAPTHFSITFKEVMNGVAYTQGTRIVGAADFYNKQLKGEAKGSILHEMVHVVQQYGSARRTNPHPSQNPGWMVEGIPDYIRWYDYEPKTGGTKIGQRGLASAKYDGSYRISANFLHYVVEKYDKNLIAEMNQSMREGHYDEADWKKLTGKTVQELGDEWKDDLTKSLASAK
jgi:Peptidase of plants and bacteria